MNDLTITIRLPRGQTIELTVDEIGQLRDTLQRLYPGSVLRPLVPDDLRTPLPTLPLEVNC